jgi:hypothetical protein
MFDPENVERYNSNEWAHDERDPNWHLSVDASDYDQLLAMYKAERAIAEAYFSMIAGRGSHDA